MRIGLGIGIGSTEGRFGQVISARALVMRFDSFANTPVVDPSDVSQWNTFFDLPTNGTPFSSVTAQGRHIYLYGGSGITVKASRFVANVNIEAFQDNSNVVVACSTSAFNGCTNISQQVLASVVSIGELGISKNDGITELILDSLTTLGVNGISDNNLLETIYAPVLTTVGDFGFAENSSIRTIYIPSVLTMGDAVTNNTVFNGISGQAITLTIPSAIMIANSGQPHASVQLLMDNNQVTIIEV